LFHGFDNSDYRQRIRTHPTDKLAYNIEKKRRQLANNPGAYNSSNGSTYSARNADISYQKLALLEEEWSARRLPPLHGQQQQQQHRRRNSYSGGQSYAVAGNSSSRLGVVGRSGRSRSRGYRGSSRRRDRSVHFDDEPHQRQGRSQSRARSTRSRSRHSRQPSMSRTYQSEYLSPTQSVVIPSSALSRTTSNHSRRSSVSRGRSHSRTRPSMPFDYSYTGRASSRGGGAYGSEYGGGGGGYPNTAYNQNHGGGYSRSSLQPEGYGGGGMTRSRSRGRDDWAYQGNSPTNQYQQPYPNQNPYEYQSALNRRVSF